MADPVPDAPSARLRGIGAMLAAVALFAVMDGVLKRFAGQTGVVKDSVKKC